MRKLAFIIAVSITSQASAEPASNPPLQDFPTSVDSCQSLFVDAKPMTDCTNVLDGTASYAVFDLDKAIASYSSTPCGTEFKLENEPVTQKNFCESLVKTTNTTPLKYSGTSCC